MNASEYDVMTEEGESEFGRPMNGTGNELISLSSHSEHNRLTQKHVPHFLEEQMKVF